MHTKIVYRAGGKSPTRFVPMGGVLLPERFTAEIDSDDDSPAIRLDIEIRDGSAQCRRVEIVSVGTGREVRGKDCRAASRLEDFIEAACAIAAALAGEGAGAVVLPRVAPNDATRAAVTAARRGRPRQMTSDRLRRVADVYRESLPDGKPTQAVADVLGLSLRTAGLYVKKAREAGHLGPAIPGRAGEATTKEDENAGR